MTAEWKSWPLPEGSGVDMWEWQDGRCAMCGSDCGRLVKDHCHMTGLVRGFLCSGCNTREPSSRSRKWSGWRAGDNPAWALKHFEIYVNHMGATPYSPQSALHWYDPAERQAWFMLSVAYLTDGRMTTWPTDAPWIETAEERKRVASEQMREAMSKCTWLSIQGRADGAA